MTDMQAFAAARGLDNAEHRIALSGGSPGVAASLDIELFQKRRASMLALLRTGAGAASYGAWLPVSETLGRSKSEKLEAASQTPLRSAARYNGAARRRKRPSGISICGLSLRQLAGRVSRQWMIDAVKGVDEIAGLLRRNIQKNIALDGLLMRMRKAV